MKAILFSTPVNATLPSIGLLIGRLAFGGFMLFGHGWGKLMKFGDMKGGFPDPLGIGSAASLAGAVTSEVLFAALILLGLCTRLASIPLIFTMLVAGFVIHAEGPMFLPGEGAKEPAVMYMVAYAMFLFLGAGRFSLDHLISTRKSNKTS